MLLEDGLVALFQAPFEDEQISSTSLVTGYTAAFTALRGYADDVDAIDPTTADLANRQVQADLFVSHAMAACFSAIAEGMAAKAHAKVYARAEEVDDDLGALDDSWNALSARGTIDADLRAQLLEIMLRTSEVLRGLEVTLPRTVVVSAPDAPASVMAYLLYDTDTRTDTLIGLNPDQAPWLFSGAVDALSQ